MARKNLIDSATGDIIGTLDVEIVGVSVAPLSEFAEGEILVAEDWRDPEEAIKIWWNGPLHQDA